MKKEFDFYTESNPEFAGRVRVSGESSHRVIISKVKKGTKLFLETAEDSTPTVAIRSADNSGSVHWDSDIVELEQIKRIANGLETSKNKMGFLAEMALSFHATATSRQIGEKPTYLMLTANVDDAKITIGSHVTGKIIKLDAEEMPMLVRKGGFLLGQEGIIIDRFTLTGENSPLYSKLLGNSFLQEISGKGFYCLEIHGDCPDEPYTLHPGEVFVVEPKRLVAMSKSVHIVDTWKVSEKQNVRLAEGADYGLVLKADVLGGKVIVADLPQERRRKPN